MLSKHLTHTAGWLSVCVLCRRGAASRGRGSLMPPVTCHTRLGRAALPWSERLGTLPSNAFHHFLLLLLLFEFVMKGGSEGWKETLQESKFILDSGERKIKLSGGVGESPPLNTKSRSLGESKGLGEGGLDTCLPAVLQAGRSCATGPAAHSSSAPSSAERSLLPTPSRERPQQTGMGHGSEEVVQRQGRASRELPILILL